MHEKLERLRGIVASILELDPAEVPEDARFYEDLGADSLEKTAITARVEGEFGVRLTAEDATAMGSLREAAEVLTKAARSVEPGQQAEPVVELAETVDTPSRPVAEAGGTDLVETLVSAHVAAGRGAVSAYVDPDVGEVGYARLLDAARGYAGALDALGIAAGTRCLLVADDSAATAAAVLGLWWRGCVPVVVSPMLTDEELAYIAGDCAAGLLHLDAPPRRQQAVAELLAALPQLSGDDVRTALAARETPGDNPAYRPSRAGAPARAAEADEVLVQYTSGSTGRPKGVRHSTGGILGLLRSAEGFLGLRAGDVVLSTARMSFGYGFGNSVLCPLAAGATTVLLRGTVDAPTVTVAVKRHRPTVLFLVPRMYAALLDQLPGAAPESVEDVRLCVAAGENLPAGLGERVRETFGAGLVNGLGATESLHIVVATPADEAMPGTFGQPVPGVTASVRDEDGAPVPDGEPGRLHIAGPTVALGYLGLPEATARAFADGGLYTGDIVRRAPDGGPFTHLCRADDLLNLGGYKVPPAEIEEVVRATAGVRDCAVVGTEDEHGLQSAVLYVQPVAEIERQALRRTVMGALRSRLAAYKRPARLEFVDEMPTTSTGKLAAFRLRERAGQR
ncbi:AMP-binding protein [Streptomyces physcomitrii]|uniref:AMP-binding protein n=1 Tax=Streptomyces physcomitrii TaxID=2724184 RepID=UPI0033DFE06D